MNYPPNFMEADVRQAIVLLNAAGEQTGRTHICHPDHARPLCGADKRNPKNTRWQIDFVAQPNCPTCLARHKEMPEQFTALKGVA